MDVGQIFSILWFFLPAGLANTSATLSKSIPGLRTLNYPIDLGKSWRGVRIFGDHKTFRGLIFATLVAAVVAVIERYLFSVSDWIRQTSTVNYVDWGYLTIAIIGGLQGSAALIGDAIKSFFKRRVGIKPGGQWFPFDQIDFLIAACLIMLPVVKFPLLAYLILFLGFVTLHRLTSIIGYFLGLKDVPY